MFCGNIEYKNGRIKICRMTKKDARKMLKYDDVTQVVLYKNGRICVDYIKTIHY